MVLRTFSPARAWWPAVGARLARTLSLMELSAPLRKAEDFGGRVLKVNHAGENGAVNIYAGQIFCARLTAPDLVGELREFKGHEENHRRIFQAELERRGVRRCRSYVLCGIGGYTLV